MNVYSLLNAHYLIDECLEMIIQYEVKLKKCETVPQMHTKNKTRI